MAPPPLGLGRRPRGPRPAQAQVEVGPLLDAVPSIDPEELGPLLEVGLRDCVQHAPRAARRPESRRVGTRRTREFYPTAEERADRERASQRVRRPSVRARPASESQVAPAQWDTRYRSSRYTERPTTVAARLPMALGSAVFAGLAYLLAAGFLASSGMIL